MQSNFQIYPLPNKIILQITYYCLVKLKATTQSQMCHTMKRQKYGNNGSPGWNVWALGDSPSLLSLRELRRSVWLEPLLYLSTEENIVLQYTKKYWCQAQSARPSKFCLHPFRATTSQTLNSLGTEDVTNTSHI